MSLTLIPFQRTQHEIKKRIQHYCAQTKADNRCCPIVSEIEIYPSGGPAG